MNKWRTSAAMLTLICVGTLLASCGDQLSANDAVPATTAIPTTARVLPQAKQTDLVPLAVPSGEAALPPPAPTLTAWAADIAANPQESWTEEFDGWKYMAYANKDKLQVTAICMLTECHNNASPNTKQSILDYVALNRKLAEELSGVAEVEVVFRYPLPGADYKDFLQQSGLSVRRCIAHFPAQDAAGPSVGLGCNGSSSTYDGAVEIDTNADAAKVKQALQDPRVFAVDLLRGLAMQKARAYLVKNKPQLANVPVEDSHSIGLYLEAEVAGLVGKQQRVPLFAPRQPASAADVVIVGELLGAATRLDVAAAGIEADRV